MPRDALRLFIAAYLPPEVAPRIGAMLDHLDFLPEHRPTPIHQIHLTLLFLGETDPRHFDWMIESVDRAASGIAAPMLTPTRLIALPDKGAPRLIALETDAPPTLLELQRRLASRLADPSRRGKDRFTPHFTLCRFADDGRGFDGRSLRAALDASTPARAITPDVVPPFALTSIRLMSSRLRPGGAEHQQIHLVDLAPSS